MRETTNTVYTDHIEQSPNKLYAVNPTANVLNALYEAVRTADGNVPKIRILGDEARLRESFNQFQTATRIADLVEQGTTSIRSIEGYNRNSMLVSEDVVSFFPATGEATPSFTIGPDNSVGELVQKVGDDWESATYFDVRAPGLSRLLETMEDELSDEYRRDFEDALADGPEIPIRGSDFSIYRLVIILAAAHEQTLYDLGHWTEDVGLASKATISREKSRLEELGVITTSKVPQNLGRPRQMLKLSNDERLDENLSEFGWI